MALDTHIADFMLYLVAERGYSTRTCASYGSDPRLLCAHLKAGADAPDLSSIATAAARSWIISMKARGLANATIARRIAALRSFWGYLQDCALVDHDPLRRIATPKKEQRLPQCLRPDEVRAIMDAAQRHAVAALAFRNYAMVAVLACAGLRRGELINLRLGDVDLVQGMLRVNGKGAKWRAVPLAEEARQAVADWLEWRPSRAACDHLFTTTQGRPVHSSRLQRTWAGILARSGVGRPGVSMHTLRHSAATMLLQGGSCDLLQVQQLLGHTRLDTTAIYLHVAPEGLESAMDRHPLSQHLAGTEDGDGGR